MTQEEFEKIIKELSQLSHEIMEGKRPEYTNENIDVLNNFKTSAKRLDISDLKCWGIFFDKQLQSIFAHIKNVNLKKSEPIESRFADVINYCYLGLALFKEREYEKKNS